MPIYNQNNNQIKLFPNKNVSSITVSKKVKNNYGHCLRLCRLFKTIIMYLNKV